MGKTDNNNKKGRRILKLVFFDIAGYLMAMGIFLLFFYIVPYELEADGDVVGNEENLAIFELPSSQVAEKDNVDNSGKDDDTSSEDNNTSKNNQSSENNASSGNSDRKTNKRGNKGGSADRSNTDTEEISADSGEAENVMSADITESQIISYEGDNTNITITKNTYGSGDDKVTYYVADVYVTSLKYLNTAFAKDMYGTNIKEDVISMADDNNAILAITGDSYGNNDTGIVVRNGVLYRSDENEADVCVLFTDGTMKTYSAAEFDEEEVLAEGVWQAWCFGPGLLNDKGDIPGEFNSTSYLTGNHPRAAIGYVEPGHYVLVVVDGRDEGYSRGVTITELAAIMQREDCKSAYNLDGGGSASMVFDGEYVNQSSSRNITDIIYVTE